MIQFQVIGNGKTEQYQFSKTGTRQYNYGRANQLRDVYTLTVNGKTVKTYQGKNPVQSFEADYNKMVSAASSKGYTVVKG